MGVNSLPKTVTRQRRGCNLNPGPSAPESSTLTTRLPSHPIQCNTDKLLIHVLDKVVSGWLQVSQFDLRRITTTVHKHWNHITNIIIARATEQQDSTEPQ